MAFKCQVCGQKSLFGRAGLYDINPRGLVCEDCREALYAKCPSCFRYYDSDKIKFKIITLTAHRPKYGRISNEEELVESKIEVCPACTKYYKSCAHSDELFDIREVGTIRISSRSYVRAKYANLYAKDPVARVYDKIEKMIEVRKNATEKVYVTKETFNSCVTLSQAWESSTVVTNEIGRCPHCGEYYFWQTRKQHDAGICQKCSSEGWHHAECGHWTTAATEYKLSSELSKEYTDVDGIIHAQQSRSRTILKIGMTVCSLCRENFMNPRTEFIAGSHLFCADQLYMYGNEKEDGPFLGIELEVDDITRKNTRKEEAAKDVVMHVGGLHVFIKYDGSLRNGFEQVTHPATLKYLLSERRRYTQLLTIPREYGFKSHDAKTCGFHIHVNKAYLTSNEIIRACAITEKFWAELFLFSRRDREEALHWAKRRISFDTQGEIIKGNRSYEDALKDKMTSEDRYMTFNLQKGYTIEFRIFRGTLNPITFWATLELVDNIIKVAKTKKEIKNLSWMDIINFHEYPELTDYNNRHVGVEWDGKLRFERMFYSDEGLEKNTGLIPNTCPKDLRENFYKIIDPEIFFKKIMRTHPQVFSNFKIGLRHMVAPGDYTYIKEYDIVNKVPIFSLKTLMIPELEESLEEIAGKQSFFIRKDWMTQHVDTVALKEWLDISTTLVYMLDETCI